MKKPHPEQNKAMQFDALRITQPSGRQVYAFAATADEILEVAEIPRIGRGEDGRLVGYQRPEVVQHINGIRQYLEGTDAVLPNTIVIAFDDSVRFVASGLGSRRGRCEYGTLEVPRNGGDVRRPGFIVDGQQRLAAIASCRHTDFSIFVTAVVASDVHEQRKQFVLVNRTKPLPQGIVFELLPEIDGVLPQALARQRFAATLVSQLNLRPDSWLHQRIRTPTCPQGNIKDNSLRRLAINSLSDGAVFQLCEHARNDDDLLEASIVVISTFWEAVSLVFSEACGLPPSRSRLTHGVGVAAMGYVMDQIYVNRARGDEWTAARVAQALDPLREHCAWTHGFWSFVDSGRRRWNELQNTDKDIRLLTNHFRRLLLQPRLVDST